MPKNNSKSRREERRASAADRQAEWDSLSVEEKLAQVADRLPAGKNIKSTAEHKKLAS